VVRAKGLVRWSMVLLAGLVALAGLLLFALGETRSSARAAGCWEAAITEQWTDVNLVGSVLRVSVHGKMGLPVEVRSRGDFRTIGFTGTKPEYGPFVAEFAPMSRGIYYIEPQGLGIVFKVWLDGMNYTRVDFTPQPCAPTPTLTPRPVTATPHFRPTATRRPATATPLPPAPTRHPPPAQGWYGHIAEHSKNPKGVYQATIAVRVIGRPAGQEVIIRSGDWGALAKTGTKPEHGPDACEFGALRAGTYRVIPTGLGTHLDVTVEQGDFVLVEFYQTGRPTTRWAGSVVKNTSGDQPTEHVNSAIAVVVAGRPWHEVEIRSDGWSTTTKTGYKPDYGPDACEFGGLRAGTYTITPKGLEASVQVTVDGWGWAMVRFDQITVPQPQPTRRPAQPTTRPTQAAQPTRSAAAEPTATPQSSPTPAGPRWRGWVISNSSGEQKGTGIWSVVVVRVLNWLGVPVTITGGGGWRATCVTGTKPEYGPDACEFGGLWPGTYRLRPEGADVEVGVTMDGLGVAIVEFAAP
jgi:hypothetical protein